MRTKDFPVKINLSMEDFGYIEEYTRSPQKRRNSLTTEQAIKHMIKFACLISARQRYIARKHTQNKKKKKEPQKYVN